MSALPYSTVSCPRMYFILFPIPSRIFSPVSCHCQSPFFGSQGKVLEPLSHLNYCKIASHYEWALKQVFDRTHAGGVRFDRVIILEDDMELAPDFFSYFRATSRLLDTDPTLFCISAWNDNGQAQFVHEPTRTSATYRFFPRSAGIDSQNDSDALTTRCLRSFV
jgi:hypothetical protein